MFCYELVDVESFGARAVNVVQIERRRIRIGDSDTKRLDGLVPVTRTTKEGSDYEQASRRPKVTAKTGEWERVDSDSGEEEAGLVSRGRPERTRCHGIQPRGGPGGLAALATAAPPTEKPRGKEPGRSDEARRWSDEGTVAALEFSQPSLSRRGTGTWQPRRGGPDLRAGGRGGAVL